MLHIPPWLTDLLSVPLKRIVVLLPRLRLWILQLQFTGWIQRVTARLVAGARNKMQILFTMVGTSRYGSQGIQICHEGTKARRVVNVSCRIWANRARQQTVIASVFLAGSLRLMKKMFLLAFLVLSIFWPQSSLTAADATAVSKWEYAIVKWDGPDRLYYNLPDKFELVYLSKTGVSIPKEAQSEEWCLAHAANTLAKEGWETIALDSRRIVLRRAAR
jgi:hypothetical protein